MGIRYAQCFARRPFPFLFLQQRRKQAAPYSWKAAEHEAKFWLDPISLVANYGFRSRDLNEIEQLIQEHQAKLLEAWHEHLG